MSDLWVEKVHEEYKDRADRDEFTHDHYTGGVKDKAVKTARRLSDRIDRDQDGNIVNVSPDKKAVYLWRRAQGETTDAYVERVILSKYPGCHAAVIDSFTGSVASIEHKADRDLSVFGDIDDETTDAYKLWRNADGQGTNYLSMFSLAAGMFSNFGRIWYLVELNTFRWIPGAHVKNWFYNEHNVLSDVLVQEMIDGRESIKDDYPDGEERIRYVHYHLEGFDRYRITKDGKGKREIEHLVDESASWDFLHIDDEGNTILPIGFVDLPIKRHPGYKMAQDANYLYNLLSDGRNLLRLANHPLLAAPDADDGLFEANSLALQMGSRYLQGKHEYTSPNVENALGAYQVYDKELRAFYVTNHQRYNDSAKETTATEARQDDQRGQQAWLNVLSIGLDELENIVLFIRSQKQFPTDPSKWHEANVERSRDFAPVDSSEFADRLMRRYIQGTVPIGATGIANVVKTIATLDGVEVDEDEIDADVDQSDLERQQAQAASDEIESLLNA